MAEPKSVITFEECVRATLANLEFVREYDRLRGTNLSCRGTGLDLMIDEASGRMEADVREFMAFVHAHVWLPLVLSEES